MVAPGSALPVVPGFQLVRRIGRGGMGEVYHAVRVGPGGFRKTVALKQLAADQSVSGRARQRFLEEAQVSAQLDHVNLVRVHDVVSAGSTYFIVMELLRGLNLVDAADALRADGPVPWWFAFEVAAQVLEGLAYAHDAGLVHRDLTPRNVFVCVGGTAKILDFGIAKRHDGPSLTHSGHIHGTIELLSPEQARGERVDRRSDLYQLGATLYWLIANRFPHGEGTPGELIARAANAAPTPLTDDVPAAVRAVIERAMASRREDRYPDAGTMAKAVHEVLATAPTHRTLTEVIAALPVPDPGESAEGRTISVTAEHTAAVAPEQPAPVTRPRRWPVVVATAAAGLGLGLATGRFTAPPRARREPPPRWLPVTLDPGVVVDARFVPGRGTVVYSGRWESNRYSVRAATPADSHARVLLDDAVIAAASSDELFVLLHPHGRAGLNGTLARMPVTSGGPRELVTDVALCDVTADGKTLAVARDQGSGWWIESPLGQRIAETKNTYQAMRLSPSGDRLAVIEHDGQGWHVELIEHGKVRRIGPVWPDAVDLVWAPDGRALWISAASATDAPTRLVALDLAGTERDLATAPQSLTLTDVDHDGRALVVSGERSNRAAGDLAGDGNEHYLPTFFGLQVIVTSDLQYFLFEDTRHVLPEGEVPIYKAPIDGSTAPVRVTDGIPLAASADGKSGVFASGHRDHVRIVSYGPGEAIEVPLGGIHDVSRAILYDDNRHLLVEGVLGSAPERVYAIDLAGGAPRPLPDGVALNTEIQIFDVQSFDGKRFLLHDASGMLVVVAPETGTVSAISGARPGDTAVGWRADDRAIYVATLSDDDAQLRDRGYSVNAGTTVVEIDLQSGERRVVRRFAPLDTSGGTSVVLAWFSRDLKRYIKWETVNHSYLNIVEGLR